MMSKLRPHDSLFPVDIPSAWRTWTWAAVVVAVLASLGGNLLAWACIAVLKRTGLYPAAPWAQIALAIVLLFGTAIALLGSWVRFFERKTIASVGFGTGSGSGLLHGILLGAGFLATVVGALTWTGGARFDHLGAITHPSSASMVSAALLAMAFLIQGSCEELVFRGWLMQVIASRYGKFIAIAASSALFALGHASNIKPSPELAMGLVNVFLFGMFLAVFAIRERSLWGPCGWHATWNWLMGVGFGLNLSGMALGTEPLFLDMKMNAGSPWWLGGGSFGPEASVMTTVVMVAAVAYWWLAGQKRR
jgi:membrane protease YdiL (CAAX protease family)